MSSSTDDPGPSELRALRALDALFERVQARYLARIAKEQPRPAPDAPVPHAVRATGTDTRPERSTP